MKTIKKGLFVLLILAIGIQFFPTQKNTSNTILKTDFIKQFNVPIHLAKKLQVSCYDCHSNNTFYPWYNKIQPIAWFLENHIDEAKEELNFAEFGAYSKRKQKSKLKSIISQIKEDEMPLTSYTLLHSDATFTADEKEEIINWINNLRDNLK